MKKNMLTFFLVFTVGLTNGFYAIHASSTEKGAVEESLTETKTNENQESSSSLFANTTEKIKGGIDSSVEFVKEYYKALGITTAAGIVIVVAWKYADYLKKQADNLYKKLNPKVTTAKRTV